MIKSILRGERLSLSPLEKDDVKMLKALYQDTVFIRLLDARPARPKTQVSLEKWIEEEGESHNGYLFGIRLIEDDTLIGFIELDGILWTHGTTWVGLGIGAEHQDQGYGTETMRIILDFAFSELNLHRVQLSVFAYNSRAIAAYERLGFIHEGTMREFLHRDGQRFDMLNYGLLRGEWEAQEG